MATETYEVPPEQNYTREMVPVGHLNYAADNLKGPQRDTPQTAVRWKQNLANRARAYGKFNPLLVTDRVASRRADGTLWPLDGNGSDHWYERMFGKEFLVPVRIPTKILSPAEEASLFVAIQRQRRSVTRAQEFQVALFDPESQESKIEAVMEAKGFIVTQATNNSRGIGNTAVTYVFKKHDAEGLGRTLDALTEIFPDEEDTARTNASLVKALSDVLYNPHFADHELLYPVLRLAGSATLSHLARGRAAEDIVVERIRELYDNTKAAGLTAEDVWEQIEEADKAEEAQKAAQGDGQLELGDEPESAASTTGADDTAERGGVANRDVKFSHGLGAPHSEQGTEAAAQRAAQDAAAEGTGEPAAEEPPVRKSRQRRTAGSGAK